MNTKHKELHNYLKSADFSKFIIGKKYKIEIHENVRKYSRYLGTEFDRTFKNIVSQINSIETNHLMHISIESSLLQDNKKLLPINISDGLNTEYNKDFSIDKFLHNYDFQSRFSYGIKNESDKNLCQEYLTCLYSKVNFEKFKAKKILITDLKINHRIIGGGGNSGFIDLIIDDKIIDIKTDIEINNIPNSYISQLLYYLIFIKYSIASNKLFNNNEYFKKLSINKVCLYYANFDLLIEFDVKKLFPDEKKLLSLLNNELVFGNNRIREIANNAILNKKFGAEYFKNIESKIIENRQNMYKNQIDSYIKTNDIEMAKSVFSVLSNEFPKSELTISFRVYLNFLMGQFTLDKKLISKHYTFISEFVENKIKYYENLLADGAWSFDCFFNDNPKNYFYFNDLIVRAKSLSIVLSNLKYFKIYIDFYKDSKNH